jgi:hypothetical protein
MVNPSFKLIMRIQTFDDDYFNEHTTGNVEDPDELE